MTLLILGLGNDLLGDDGIGLMAAEDLENRRAESVTVTKSALSGLYLIDLVEGFDDLIILDSVLGEPAGKVVQLEIADIGPRIVPSAHHAGLPEALEIAKRAGMKMPSRVAVLAVQIRDSQVLGTAVSPAVRSGLPDLVRRVEELSRLWGYDIESRDASMDAAAGKRG